MTVSFYRLRCATRGGRDRGRDSQPREQLLPGGCTVAQRQLLRDICTVQMCDIEGPRNLASEVIAPASVRNEDFSF